MPEVEDAILLATTAHKGQKDKADASYILHPLRVMLQMDTPVEMMAAVLHDVVEDTTYNLEDLKTYGYSSEVIEAVDYVTHRKGETYEEFVKRAKQNPLARKVKIADLRDNMNLSRVKNPTQKDFDRLERYRKALAYLLED